MKQKTIALASVVLSVFALTSCSSYYRYDESTARFVEPQMKTYVSPTIADLDVQSTRITHTEFFNNTLTIDDIYRPENSEAISYMKSYTISMAVKENNADVIIAPNIDIKTSDDCEIIEVTVVGYPAKYINFRKATEKDINLINKSNATQFVIVTDKEKTDVIMTTQNSQVK